MKKMLLLLLLLLNWPLMAYDPIDAWILAETFRNHGIMNMSDVQKDGFKRLDEAIQKVLPKINENFNDSDSNPNMSWMTKNAAPESAIVLYVLYTYVDAKDEIKYMIAKDMEYLVTFCLAMVNPKTREKLSDQMARELLEIYIALHNKLDILYQL